MVSLWDVSEDFLLVHRILEGWISFYCSREFPDLK